MRTLLNTVYLGRYRIEALLGAGRNAKVYRAFDMVRQGQIALKLYGEDSLDHQTAEAAAQHQLIECPSVLPLLDVHPAAVPFEATSMPLATGTLGTSTPISVPEARRQMLRVTTALDYCHNHECGVIHGDVKPANCFVDRHGHAQLGDFGVADFLPDGRRGHTLEYAAPELLAGEARTPATDVWAAMTMYYELLCGEMPFGSTADDPEPLVAARISSGRVPTVASHRPFLPRAVQTMFDGAFVVDPARRFPTTASDAHNEIAKVTLRADWVRMRQAGVLERWEGVELDNEGAPTGTKYLAELRDLPNAGRHEATVQRSQGNRRFQAWPGARKCEDASEARTRQCMYARMRAVTAGRRPA